MVEATGSQTGADLLPKLQAETDWNMSSVFTDKEEVLSANNCPLEEDEIK